MLEEHLKFVLGDRKSKAVGCVDDENDSLSLRVVVLPESAVFTLSRHVEHSEVDLILLK